MWTWHRKTWRVWDIERHAQYEWCKYWHARGHDVLSEIFFVPNGWFLVSWWDWRGPGSWSYSLHVIEDGHFVGEWPMTFDEFERFPLMAPGFFVPF